MFLDAYNNYLHIKAMIPSVVVVIFAVVSIVVVIFVVVSIVVVVVIFVVVVVIGRTQPKDG